jgi:glycosyltransferase involved in cell wall biosynthesis
VEIHNRPALIGTMESLIACKLALHLHNNPQDMEGARTPAERTALLARCAGVYCVSNYIRDRFLEGLPPETGRKLHVIYNGIEIPQAQTAKEKLIVFAGRMTEGKGALLLARALRIALPALPRWRAVMIGSRRHEACITRVPYEQQIAQVLAPLGKQAELAGFLPHPETLGYFARAGIAMIPSVWEEPFGRTAIEAMAYGCAIISSGRGGLHEVTADTALAPKAMTPEGMAETLVMLAGDAPQQKHLQQMAHRRATDRFAITTRVHVLDKVRERILERADSVAT